MPKLKKQQRHMAKMLSNKKIHQIHKLVDQIGLPLPKIHNLIKNIIETEHTNKEQICQATQTIHELSESQKANANEEHMFQTIRNMTEQQKANANEEQMFQSICNMPEKQKANALNLFNIMRYPKGRHANEIISPYLQKKHLNLLQKIYTN
ncbi:2859_t:CDS:1, partial [Gigaspora rosea]